MKYSITINQVGIFKAGLHTKTDISDWALIDYIWDKETSLGLPQGEYIPIKYSSIMSDIPMLGISTKDPLTDRFKRLQLLGLVVSCKSPNNHMFIKLTNLTYSIINGGQHG